MMDGQCPELARLSVFDCLEQATFDEILICSPNDLDIKNSRWVKTPEWKTVTQCINFEWLVLPWHITTKFMLFCQWDAWIIDASQWLNEFYEYDYIGAPWWYNDDYNVGCDRDWETT